MSPVERHLLPSSATLLLVAYVRHFGAQGFAVEKLLVKRV